MSRIPKVGEIWLDNTWVEAPNRKCRIVRIEDNHVEFEFVDSPTGRTLDWLLEDFLEDARLDESENVKQILKNYGES